MDKVPSWTALSSKCQKKVFIFPGKYATNVITEKAMADLDFRLSTVYLAPVSILIHQ